MHWWVGAASRGLMQRPLMAVVSHWQVWPGQTVFPDYTSENCIEWWVDEYKKFSQEIKHDALWIVSDRERNHEGMTFDLLPETRLHFAPAGYERGVELPERICERL